jgi:hypothetical protein
MTQKHSDFARRPLRPFPVATVAIWLAAAGIWLALFCLIRGAS